MKEMNGGIKKFFFNQQPKQYGLMGVFAGNLELKPSHWNALSESLLKFVSMSSLFYQNLCVRIKFMVSVPHKVLFCWSKKKKKIQEHACHIYATQLCFVLHHHQ